MSANNYEKKLYLPFNLEVTNQMICNKSFVFTNHSSGSTNNTEMLALL